METLIKTTMLIIIIFTTMNLLLFSFIYTFSKKKLYLKFSFFWASLIAIFVVQALAQGSETLVIVGFACNLLPLNLLADASMSMINQSLPRKTLAALSCFALASSGLAIYLLAPFWLKALPLTIALSTPMCLVSWKYLRSPSKEVNSLMKLYAVILFAVVVHNFNFAFFRMDPNAALWGWPVAYGIYQALAAIIPAMSLDFYHREEEARLTAIIDQKTEALLLQNDSLQQALTEKTFLLRTLVHDVSNPLMVITLSCKGVEGNEKFNSLVNKIDRMATRIQSLIQQLKTYEKFKSGLADEELEEVDIKEVFDDVLELFQDRMRAKQIQIRSNTHEFAGVAFLAGRNSVRNSIIPNILSNAIKFSPPGATIHIVCHQTKDELALSIRDEGDGIPPNLLETIFEFDSRTNRKGTLGETGTGFGLPITNTLIKSYGGKIEVHSKVKSNANPNQSGTEVRLIFPKLDQKPRLEAA
ncbi:MAG: HAMP domain-containing histidine kinase [Bdellovibrionales bacterium]|nr:HAMP domain-containing histidine kinase [Bdellovibrionales bacterium]